MGLRHLNNWCKKTDTSLGHGADSWWVMSAWEDNLEKQIPNLKLPNLLFCFFYLQDLGHPIDFWRWELYSEIGRRSHVADNPVFFGFSGFIPALHAAGSQNGWGLEVPNSVSLYSGWFQKDQNKYKLTVLQHMVTFFCEMKRILFQNEGNVVF